MSFYGIYYVPFYSINDCPVNKKMKWLFSKPLVGSSLCFQNFFAKFCLCPYLFIYPNPSCRLFQKPFFMISCVARVHDRDDLS